MTRAHDVSKNIQLLQTVERFPELYDICSPLYSDRNKQMLTWKTVADELNDSVENCKDTWKKLRTALMKNLRDQPASGSGGAAKKPYYLQEYMGFLMPHIKSRIQRGNLESSLIESGRKDSEHAGMEQDISDQSYEESLTGASELGESEEKVVQKRKVRVVEKPAEVDVAVLSYIKKKQQQKEHMRDDPDFNFLMSILPDIRSLDKKRKLKFKKNLLDLITEYTEDIEKENDCMTILSIDCD